MTVRDTLEGTGSRVGSKCVSSEVPYGGEYTGVRSSALDLPHFATGLTSRVGKRMADSIESGRWQAVLGEILDEMDQYGVAS